MSESLESDNASLILLFHIQLLVLFHQSQHILMNRIIYQSHNSQNEELFLLNLQHLQQLFANENAKYNLAAQLHPFTKFTHSIAIYINLTE